ncbi:probable serine/threonine-protein kinase DDB_G0288147 [Acanthaster planci]|uniref:Probable serine/threonine-protein kinase DDB_G0288147 n=1 Tax=Acanthaster planci TaxID=133434 RepID=A0A8B7Y634_ACAPL|nr:probable serine/threonine-protein kinase DDB_G0288147 [Acanthaster planci]
MQTAEVRINPARNVDIQQTMDHLGLTRFNTRLRIPLRHKKRRQVTQTAPDPTNEPPPSYSECSAFFYAPPSYEEIFNESVTALVARPERRRSINRMSWGSDTSTSSLESSSSAHSASSTSAPPSSFSTAASTSSSSSRVVPTAPPLSPPATSSTLSLWLSSVSPSTSRNVENLSRHTHRCASSDPIISSSSSSASDVISRLQPRLRSWTQCVRWVIQYTLEGNFKSTVAHFLCLVNEGLRVCRQHAADTEAYPIRLSSLAVARPTALSLRTWIEFILCVGFKFSQGHVNSYNNNYNNNINHNNRGENDDDDHPQNFLAYILANTNNSNGNIGDELEDLCVIVPRGFAPRQLLKHRDVLTGLLELPYTAIKTAANMSRTETERIIALLTPLTRSSPDTSSVDHAPSWHHALSLDHALVRSVWDVHRRPGFFLHSLDFIVSRGGEGGKCLTVPTGEVARRRLLLAKDILEMFLRN